MFKSYSEILEYLARVTNYERMSPVRATPRAYNLRRMNELLRRLGHPQRRFRPLHIAGTKGKGSVAHLTEAVLRSQGLRTGLYISPHLIDMLERIQVDGKPVSRHAFVRLMNRLLPALRGLGATYFEIMTAAAFQFFAEKNVDVAVVEVGLGGRLDCTNVIQPQACAITAIDYDHQEVLGHTLEAIAREKAGIIKRGVPVVVAPQRPGVERVIRSVAVQRDAPMIVPWSVRNPRSRLRGGRFVLEFTTGAQRYALTAAGRHQGVNVGVALALAERVIGLSAVRVRKALRSVRIPGRIEWVGRRPDVVVDTAHNPVSARALRETLDELLPGRPRVMVFGAARDKDVAGMVRELRRGVRLWIFTRARNPRALEPEKFLGRAGGMPAVAVGSVERAVILAKKVAGPRDVVVVTGSFSVAGEALEVLR